MLRDRLVAGALAGAAGTASLNMVSYADMAVRGRPSSEVPAEIAGEVAERVGIPLGADEQASNRRQGLGALLGLGTGTVLGALYGVAAPRGVPGRSGPVLTAGTAMGLAAMALSDGPAAAMHKTEPRTWGVGGWLSDLLPHLAYGVTLVVTHDRLTGRR